MRVGFKYYQDEDRMVFDTSVTKLLPGDNVIAPFVGNIEMGAKVHTEDCERAISFFTSNFDFSHGNYTFLRILDRNGNFPWFQVSMSERNGDGCLIGSIEPLNSDNVSESNAYRLAFFNNLKDFLNEIPIYDVPNLFLIKLTDYKSLYDMKGSEHANKAFEDALAVVKGVLRASDVVAPAGDGVIFAYLLGVKDDMILCDRATSIISSLRISWGAYSENLKEVVSIGISTVKHDGTMNIAELYAKAAVALVSAEEKHKNTYALYSDNVKGEEQFVGKNVSLHDIELVKNILDPIKTWAYAVDERMHLIYKNDALSERIPGESLGYCYKLIKGNNKQCEDCPLKKFENDISSVDADVYSPGLRRVIHTRTTRLRMRNNIKVYIIADTKEDIGAQLDALKESTKHYNKAMQKIQDIIWEIDLDTLSCIRIREVNILSMVEKRVEDFEGLRDYYMNHVVYPDDTEDFMYATSPAHLREIARIGREMVDSKVRFLYQDGTYHWYSISAIFEEDKVFLVARDINDLSHDIVQDYVTSRRFREIKTDSQARSELAKNYERSEHVNELTGIYVFEYDAAEKDYYLSTTFENMFEVTDNMLSGEWTLLEGLPPHTDDREKYENFLHRVRSGSDTHEITIRLVNKYNVALWFTITVQTLQGIGNSLARITGCIQDVNTEMEIKQELEFRADYDSLTGLFNSGSFYRSVEERLLMRPDSKFAIISVDIDRFRIINDRFGVEAGNACLRELGRVIHSSLPWDGLAARYQADMYSILFEYSEEHDLLEYIEKLTLAFHVDEAIRCGSTLSYGIYKIDERNISVRLMCDRARLAKKNIKGTTLTNFNVYDDNIRLKDNQQAELESEMEIALRETQTKFYALAVDEHEKDGEDGTSPQGLQFQVDDAFNLRQVTVRDADHDGSLRWIVSTFDPYDQCIYDGYYEGKNRKIVSFSGVLQNGVFPLPELLQKVLYYGQKEMARPVEIEFAVNLHDDRTGDFYLLQIRPMVDNQMQLDEDLTAIADEACLLRSHNAIGHGVLADVLDVVYVKTDNYNAAHNPTIAEEIELINRGFLQRGENYVLVGPGRWGSSDPWLGIPVKWPNISAAKVIIEAGLRNFRVEPSQGTHFFQNLTSMGVGYFTVNDFLDDGIYRQDLLNALPAVEETAHVRHVRFSAPIVIKIDGMKKEGVVLMPSLPR